MESFDQALPFEHKVGNYSQYDGVRNNQCKVDEEIDIVQIESGKHYGLFNLGETSIQAVQNGLHAGQAGVFTDALRNVVHRRTEILAERFHFQCIVARVAPIESVEQNENALDGQFVNRKVRNGTNVRGEHVQGNDEAAEDEEGDKQESAKDECRYGVAYEAYRYEHGKAMSQERSDHH